jgi:predicted nucleic acid-binding Zn ribbon protein
LESDVAKRKNTMPIKTLHDKKKRRPLTATSTKYLTKPKSINELLSKSSVLRELGHSFAPQEEWLDWLRKKLPESLATHVNGVELKPGALFVYTDSANWSARVRYAMAELDTGITERNGSALKVSVRQKL